MDILYYCLLSTENDEFRFIMMSQFLFFLKRRFDAHIHIRIYTGSCSENVFSGARYFVGVIQVE